ncbi:MAG: hypothetical protein WAN03_18515 [Candidatus Sulfotelmatobacter sp.]
MPSGRVGSELAVLALLCVISIFLFPVAQGPYTAIHGPVTALQSFRSAVRLKLALVTAGLASAGSLFAALAAFSTIRFQSAEFLSPLYLELSPILRC